MLSSNRSALVLSISSALALLGWAACIDPQGRFDEYTNRAPVKDGGGAVLIDAMPIDTIPDISGKFLLGLKVYFVPKPIQVLVTTTMTRTGKTAKVDMTLQYLAVTGRTPVGSPFTLNNVAVNEDGSFDIAAGTLQIPKDANPLGNDATTENVKLPGQILSVDGFCGLATGQITNPPAGNLEDGAGSTFAAVRVTGGTTDAELPKAKVSCADLTATPDAGP